MSKKEHLNLIIVQLIGMIIDFSFEYSFLKYWCFFVLVETKFDMFFVLFKFVVRACE